MRYTQTKTNAKIVTALSVIIEVVHRLSTLPSEWHLLPQVSSSGFSFTRSVFWNVILFTMSHFHHMGHIHARTHFAFLIIFKPKKIVTVSRSPPRFSLSEVSHLTSCLDCLVVVSGYLKVFCRAQYVTLCNLFRCIVNNTDVNGWHFFFF